MITFSFVILRLLFSIFVGWRGLLRQKPLHGTSGYQWPARELPSTILVQRCVHDARGYGVEADIFFCVLDCQAPGHSIQASFRDHRNRGIYPGDCGSASAGVTVTMFP